MEEREGASSSNGIRGSQWRAKESGYTEGRVVGMDLGWA